MQGSAAKLEELSKSSEDAAAQLRASSRNTENSATKGTLLDIGASLESLGNEFRQEAARLGAKPQTKSASAGVFTQITESIVNKLHPGEDTPALNRCYERLTGLLKDLDEAQQGHAEPDTRQILIKGQRTVKESLTRLDELISEQG